MNTKERTPVPVLGDGWFLLTAEDGELKKGDRGTAGGIDGGWVDASLLDGQQVSTWLERGCLAARYFGPTKEPEPTVKPIDWTKPVRTKDGRAVRVLCTDGPGDYPVCGYIDGDLGPQTWALDGVFLNGGIGHLNLENAPQRIQREYWVNVYADEACNAIHTTLDEANRCADDDRIACVKITIDCEEGEGL